jgi:hypothetical protein
MFQPHGTESGDYYKQFYIMLRGGMISIMEDVRLCNDCEFCKTIKGVSIFKLEIIFMLVILQISYFN